MMKIGLVAAVALFGLLYVNALANQEAMAKCQVTHSFDTCHSNLYN